MNVAFVIAVAVLLGLLLFVIREVRRPPGPKQWGRTPRWGKRLRVTLDVIILVLAAMVVWGFLIEPRRLIVRHETIDIKNWPQQLSGLRVAVIADIHADDWAVDNKKLRAIVERTNQLQPELIVILGDYMSGNGWVKRVEPEVFAATLKDFRAPLGVYSVLGNHDWWYDGGKVRRALEQNGIKVLENETLQLNARGTSLWLVGLADLWTRRPQRVAETVAKVPQGQPVIALTHNPDIFPTLPQSVPLLLAGHTHGGQVRFPLIGAVVQSTDFGERYEWGHVFENDHHLFVTTGIGTSILPVRFGVPPEIVLLTVNQQNRAG